MERIWRVPGPSAGDARCITNKYYRLLYGDGDYAHEGPRLLGFDDAGGDADGGGDNNDDVKYGGADGDCDHDDIVFLW